MEALAYKEASRGFDRVNRPGEGTSSAILSILIL
jgi:hypothetical protein